MAEEPDKIKYIEDLIRNQRVYLINSTLCNNPYDSSIKLPFDIDDLRKREPSVNTEQTEVLQNDQTLLCCFSEYSVQ